MGMVGSRLQQLCDIVSESRRSMTPTFSLNMLISRTLVASWFWGKMHPSKPRSLSVNTPPLSTWYPFSVISNGGAGGLCGGEGGEGGAGGDGEGGAGGEGGDGGCGGGEGGEGGGEGGCSKKSDGHFKLVYTARLL